MHLRTVCVLIAFVLPSISTAQSVRGVVVDARGAPAADVVSVLLDSTMSVVARSLSNARGEFAMSAERAGTYQVRALRIGFPAVTSPRLLLGAGQTVDTRIALGDVRLQLATIRVSAKGVCEANAQMATQTFAVWEQARAALAATEMNMRAQSMFAVTVQYARTVERTSGRITNQDVSTRSGVVKQPWLALPVSTLVKEGYVRTQGDTTTYRAPGLDMLMSDEFVTGHCLRLVAGDSKRLGIAFTPITNRPKIADIRGTIWLDRASAELRQLQFGYTGVTPQQARAAGGDIEFVRMNNGAWIISRWNVNMPVFTHRKMPIGNYDPQLLLVETRVQGGELSLATTQSSGRGDTLWMRAPLTMRGTVADSATRRLLPGANVTLVGTSLSAVANASGQFAITGVIPGEYTANVRTQALDNINTSSYSYVTFLDSTSSIALRVVSPLQVLDELCPRLSNAPGGPAAGAIIGSIARGVSNEVPATVRIVAQWQEITLRTSAAAAGINRRAQYLETRSDSVGRYRICGVPLNTALTVRAIGEKVSSPPRDVRVSAEEGVARVELLLEANAVRTAVLLGAVVTDSSNRTLPGAEVLFPELGLASRADARGEYRIADIPPGTHKLVVRSLGYSPLEAEITLAPNQTDERLLYLHRVTVLDSVMTMGTERRLRDFEDNMRVGLGRFLTREDLAKRQGRSMSSMIGEFNGVRIVRGKGASAWAARSRGVQSLSGAENASGDSYDRLRGAQSACYAHVWIDGVQVYRGGIEEPLFDLNTIHPDEIEALEFYAGPAQTPAKYSVLKSTCGVIVIWRRR